MRYHREIPNNIYVQHNWGMICKKRAIERTKFLVEPLKKLTVNLEIAYLEFATNI